MKSLKGTRTAENLMKHFGGESQARTRYTYYASIAKNKGMFKYQIYLWKQQNKKKSMLRNFINI